ncbi:hypothetical protein C8R32_102281 [Nitrosospira sp. Nsp5]|uniref:Uncharacterized protein n=1 Tax=Nitrosospira multiformis TaxID=1231 RepID=A0ABY0TJX2_9PROT|nr:hypothetical protein C8R32_102281 [Nitrosospira sp. Nsp5]SDQ95512.1 hypothetical protein SAMN05216402_2977 [Nitrosospira multiformis]
MFWVHAHFIPNASIQMKVENPSFWDKISLTFNSLVIGIGASLIAAYMYSKLT